MSYLGSSAAPIPVAFSGVRTQSFSGNGSTSLFTLSRAVTLVTDIEVIVNNVQQSPFDGSYSLINNGLGLQFSENVSAGTNNVYVFYRDQPLGSVIDTTAVRKTGDTMTGALFIQGSTGTISLNAAGDQLLFNYNGYNYVTANGAAATLQLQATGANGVVAVSTAGVNRATFNANGLTVAGNMIVSAESGGTRTMGAASGTNTTVVIQGSTSIGGGPNIELTKDNVAYFDSNIIKFRSTDASVSYGGFDTAGRLTVPNQVAFCGAQSLSVLSGGIVNWNVARLNKGSHLNIATGKFTAPVAGMYFFSANLISGSTAASSCNIVVNGVVLSSGYTQYDNYNTTATTLAVELSVGDWVALTTDGAFYAGTYYGAFTGFLIG